jgi:hypothetical protein
MTEYQHGKSQDRANAMVGLRIGKEHAIVHFGGILFWNPQHKLIPRGSDPEFLS